MNFNILSLIIFLPLAGALAIGLIPRLPSRWARIISLLFTFAVLVLSVVLLFRFDRQASGMQFEEIYSWIPSLGAFYHLGVDGISLPLVAVTSLLGLVAVLMSWNIENRTREFSSSSSFGKSRLSRFISLFQSGVPATRGVLPQNTCSIHSWAAHSCWPAS
jgi:NADH-quinone oxidoreductase subunit M